MSVLGILARGAEGAMKGGDVLAKGQEKLGDLAREQGKEQRAQLMWDRQTEVLRQNNLDAIEQQRKNAAGISKQEHTWKQEDEESRRDFEIGRDVEKQWNDEKVAKITARAKQEESKEDRASREKIAGMASSNVFTSSGAEIPAGAVLKAIESNPNMTVEQVYAKNGWAGKPVVAKEKAGDVMDLAGKFSDTYIASLQGQLGDNLDPGTIARLSPDIAMAYINNKGENIHGDPTKISEELKTLDEDKLSELKFRATKGGRTPQEQLAEEMGYLPTPKNKARDIRESLKQSNVSVLEKEDQKDSDIILAKIMEEAPDDIGKMSKYLRSKLEDKRMSPYLRGKLQDELRAFEKESPPGVIAKVGGEIQRAEPWTMKIPPRMRTSTGK